MFFNVFVRFAKWIFLIRYMDLSKLLDGFVTVDTWICQSFYMDLLHLLFGFVKVVLCISEAEAVN